MTAARAAGALAAALGVWALAWYLVLHPTHVLWAAALAAPALLCARPEWRDRKLAHGIAGFLAILYLAHGLTEVVANPDERLAAGVAIALALAWLACATHALRGHAARASASG